MMIKCQYCKTKKKENQLLPKRIRTLAATADSVDKIRKATSLYVLKVPKNADRTSDFNSSEYLRWVQIKVFDETRSKDNPGFNICLDCIDAIRTDMPSKNLVVMKSLVLEKIKNKLNEGDIPMSLKETPPTAPAAPRKRASKKPSKKRAKKKPTRKTSVTGKRKKFENGVRKIVNDIKDLKPLYQDKDIKIEDKKKAEKYIKASVDDLSVVPMDLDFRL